MKAAARCDTGLVREINQDRVFVSETRVGFLPNLLIVADGMGGHRAGDKASQITVDTVLEEIQSMEKEPDDIGTFLASCAEEANRRVFEASMSNYDWQGMGTTLVAATVIGKRLYCINVGDSRLYLLREDEIGERRLEQLTEDHSYVWGLMRSGLITEEEAFRHEKKNLITRAIGQEEDVAVDIYCEDISDVRFILMCSDGLSDMIDKKEIMRILSLPGLGPDEIAESMKNAANNSGGKDNISVIVADPREEGDLKC